jgi:hypothetical protein
LVLFPLGPTFFLLRHLQLKEPLRLTGIHWEAIRECSVLGKVIRQVWRPARQWQGKVRRHYQIIVIPLKHIEYQLVV